MDCIGSYSIVMQNGIPLVLVMGKSTTAGAGPYTHTITAPTDGSSNPSFTWQHERTGTATDWAVQFTGCKVSSLSLICSENGRYLIGAMNTVAQKAVDPGFTLTNDPALPATATTEPYKFTGMTRTWDYGSANTAVNGLKEMELSISPDLDKLYTANWSAGTWTGQWPYKILDGAPMKYEFIMQYVPESDDIWDELVSLSNTKELYLKWAKSANDYIAVTLSNCWVTAHEIVTADADINAMDEGAVEVHMVPESVSFEVKDMIAAAHYGE